MINVVNDLLPRAPWTQAPKDEAAGAWRALCGIPLATIFTAIYHNGEEGYLSSRVQCAGAHHLISVLFREAEPTDREGLIRWLGRACAMGTQDNMYVEGRTGGQGRVTTDMVCAALLQRWTASAWRWDPYFVRPAWSGDLVDQSTDGIVLTDGPWDTWKGISGWNDPPVDVEASVNPQRDLLAFLQAFEKQGSRQAENGGRPIEQPIQSQVIPMCCVALNILANTTDRLDERLRAPLAFFESVYDHTGIDGEILRHVGSDNDRRALLSVGAEGEPVDSKNIWGEHQPRWRKRAL